MTADLPAHHAPEMCDPIADAERELAARAGEYLRNVIREPGVTCAVCATPVRGSDRCLACEKAATTPGIADLVVPLSYAIHGEQSGAVLHGYKNDPARPVRGHHARVVKRLLYLGIMLHQRCIETRIGQRVDVRLTIPSLKDRPGPHPLYAIARAMNAVNAAPRLTARFVECYRDISARTFLLTPRVDLGGRHVLLLDDTWTTGSNAASATLTLRAAGADRVSVMVIGRWVKPGYARNAAFISERLRERYHPRRCPVTGGDCP